MFKKSHIVPLVLGAFVLGSLGMFSSQSQAQELVIREGSTESVARMVVALSDPGKEDKKRFIQVIRWPDGQFLIKRLNLSPKLDPSFNRLQGFRAEDIRGREELEAILTVAMASHPQFVVTIDRSTATLSANAKDDPILAQLQAHPPVQITIVNNVMPAPVVVTPPPVVVETKEESTHIVRVLCTCDPIMYQSGSGSQWEIGKQLNRRETWSDGSEKVFPLGDGILNRNTWSGAAGVCQKRLEVHPSCRG